MKLLIVSGSRADWGLLQWPIKVLSEDAGISAEVVKIHGCSATAAFAHIEYKLRNTRPDMMLVLGDRFEILGAVFTAHLLRVPVAHIGGGDVTEGSYDDAMRDSISRMAAIHFVTSTSAMARLSHSGYRGVHLVGNPGIDYIKHGQWKAERPYADKYVVVSYQAETIDGTNDVNQVLQYAVSTTRKVVVILPNPDEGSEAIQRNIEAFNNLYGNLTVTKTLPYPEFLNLIYHCTEFIGNSSSMLYEAPELEVKTKMVGKRQKGRTIPWGDGNASTRILHVLKYGAF